jgi:hypothetical protein
MTKPCGGSARQQHPTRSCGPDRLGALNEPEAGPTSQTCEKGGPYRAGRHPRRREIPVAAVWSPVMVR